MLTINPSQRKNIKEHYALAHNWMVIRKAENFSLAVRADKRRRKALRRYESAALQKEGPYHPKSMGKTFGDGMFSSGMLVEDEAWGQ